MNRTLAAGVALGFLLSASPSFAEKVHYKANLEGGAVGSPGVGVGNFTFDTETNRLCGKATYSGLTGGPVTGALLKEADFHEVVATLPVSDSPILVDVVLSDTHALQLDSGPIYIVIGNDTHPVGAGEDTNNGEINGELDPDPEGVEQPCPGDAPDAGTDASIDAAPEEDSGTSSGAPSTSGTVPSSEDQPAAEPEPEEAPTPKKKDEGGCSTTSTGSSTGSFVLVAGAIALLIGNRKRLRR
jgi:hypothetical protein